MTAYVFGQIWIFLCIYVVSVIKFEDNWTHVLSGSICLSFKYAQQNKFEKPTSRRYLFTSTKISIHCSSLPTIKNINSQNVY